MRFAPNKQLTDEQLIALPAVKRIGREEDEVALYTPDVPATISGLLRLADEQGAGNLDIAVRRPTLEDVFLELTGRALRD